MVLTNFFGLFQSLNRTQFQKNYLYAAVISFMILSGLGFLLVVIFKIGILGFTASVISLTVGNIIAIIKIYMILNLNLNGEF